MDNPEENNRAIQVRMSNWFCIIFGVVSILHTLIQFCIGNMSDFTALVWMTMSVVLPGIVLLTTYFYSKVDEENIRDIRIILVTLYGFTFVAIASMLEFLASVPKENTQAQILYFVFIFIPILFIPFLVTSCFKKEKDFCLAISLLGLNIFYGGFLVFFSNYFIILIFSFFGRTLEL